MTRLPSLEIVVRVWRSVTITLIVGRQSNVRIAQSFCVVIFIVVEVVIFPLRQSAVAIFDIGLDFGDLRAHLRGALVVTLLFESSRLVLVGFNCALVAEVLVLEGTELEDLVRRRWSGAVAGDARPHQVVVVALLTR